MNTIKIALLSERAPCTREESSLSNTRTTCFSPRNKTPEELCHSLSVRSEPDESSHHIGAGMCMHARAGPVRGRRAHVEDECRIWVFLQNRLVSRLVVIDDVMLLDVLR
eukprot:3063746-Rhodomonas_salina.1